MRSVCARVARMLGAKRAWVLGKRPEDICGVRPLPVLGCAPVSCVDVREQARAARARGDVAAFDLTEVRGVGCPAIRLGAHLACLAVGEFTLVGVSADAPEWIVSALDQLPARAGEEPLEGLVAELDGLAAKHRAASDAAQVVAHYLACHPRVAEVAYPGLKGDASFEVAARTLECGFGPRVCWRVTGDDGWCELTLSPEDDPRAVIMDLEREVLHV